MNICQMETFLKLHKVYKASKYSTFRNEAFKKFANVTAARCLSLCRVFCDKTYIIISDSDLYMILMITVTQSNKS